MLWKLILVPLVAVAVLATACGDDSDDGDDNGGDAEATTSAPAPTTDAGGEATPDGGDDDGDDNGSGGNGDGERATLPDDACALVTAEELATLVPDSQPGSPTSDAGGGESRLCLWQSDSEAAGMSINVEAYPSEISTDLIVEELESNFADAGADAKEVEGVGEFAYFVSPRENVGELVGVVKGLELTLRYDGPAGTGEAELIVIAKAVEERL